MSQFCSVCTLKMLGKEVKPDINIQLVFEKLNEGSYTPVLCEGCGLAAIGKFKDNKLMLAMPNSEGTYSWLTEEEFINIKISF